MDERIMQFRVGVMVFATLLITAILVVMFGELPKFVRGEYIIKIAFEQAPGVAESTPVRKSGILIGRVTKVEFAKDPQGREDTRVLVTANIDGDKSVYQDEVCYVQSNLLGDAALEFIRTPSKDKPTARIEPGAQINGKFTSDPGRLIGDMQGDLKESISSVISTSKILGDVSKTLSATLTKVNDVLDENRSGLKNAVDQSARTMASVERAANSAQQILGDEESQKAFHESLRRMPQIAEEAQCTLRNLRSAATQVDRTFSDVGKITAALSSETFIGRLESGSQNLDRTMAAMAEFSGNLNNPNGSLGRLVRDPELYQSLNRTVRNVERLTRELQPIVDDAKVFSDKVSRHPGVIVRDAIRPGPGIK